MTNVLKCYDFFLSFNVCIISNTLSFVNENKSQFPNMKWDAKIKRDIWRYLFTLKMCSVLKIENKTSSVNMILFREQTHLLALELIFVSSNLRVYMDIKFNLWKKRLKWYKKRSVLAKWALQNNSDALAATHIKWKNEKL